jgi:hypothetical protein
MPRVPTIPEQLNALYPAQWLRAQALATGAVKRSVKVDIVVFFWALVLAPVVGAAPSLAGLQRVFESMARIVINPSAYLKRFSEPLVLFLETCAQRAFAEAIARWFDPKVFSPFREVLAIDSSLVKLKDSLQVLFPGPRTNSAPAVAKVHAVYSVISGALRHVSIFAGKTSEVKVLKLDRDLKDTLLLYDLGYFQYSVFARIARQGGFFVSRMKHSANPVIVADRYRGPGRKRNLVGQRLWDALAGIGRETVDLDVEAVYQRKRRPTASDKRKSVTERRRFRVVGVRHPETNELHVYLTNLTPEQATPEQIRVIYTARWIVELLFDELKNYCGMSGFPSARPEIVRALIYLAVIRLAVCRAAMQALQQRMLTGVRDRDPALVPTVKTLIDERCRSKRFLLAWSTLSLLMLPEILCHAGIPWDSRSLEKLLLKSMLDPNRRRNTLPSRLRGLR